MTLLWIVFDKRIKTRIKIELYGNMFVVVYQSSVAVVIFCRWLVEAIPGKMPGLLEGLLSTETSQKVT